MKKLIIASFVAALFAACNSTPAVNESTANVAKLTSWVDSIKGEIAKATTHDSATWANWNNEFNTVVGSIKAEELDEAGKASLTAAQEAWTAAGTDFTAKMNEEKAAAAATIDTTAAAAGDATLLEKAGEAAKVEAGKAIDKATK